jgi:IS1 family transposase
MTYNSFDYYRHLREYQLHVQKLANPETNVPPHEAYKPIKPQIDKLKEFERQQKTLAIERENEVIMHKLVKINRRKPSISQSSPALVLPSIRR